MSIHRFTGAELEAMFRSGLGQGKALTDLIREFRFQKKADLKSLWTAVSLVTQMDRQSAMKVVVRATEGSDSAN